VSKCARTLKWFLIEDTMHQFHGSCHCGNLEVDYRTTVAAEDSSVRACQCSFCRKHDARAISDPAGSITITALDPNLLERYRFGLAVVEFLLCRKCGVYVSAYTQDSGEAYANVMINVLDDRKRFPQPNAVHLDGENQSDKWKRHSERWTPATLQLGDG
jgi:hypothetical protein